MHERPVVTLTLKPVASSIRRPNEQESDRLLRPRSGRWAHVQPDPCWNKARTDRTPQPPRSPARGALADPRRSTDRVLMRQRRVRFFRCNTRCRPCWEAAAVGPDHPAAVRWPRRPSCSRPPGPAAPLDPVTCLSVVPGHHDTPRFCSLRVKRQEQAGVDRLGTTWSHPTPPPAPEFRQIPRERLTPQTSTDQDHSCRPASER